MKNSLLVTAIAACVLSSAPMASAPAKPAMSMGTDARVSPMQAKMQEMQAQMGVTEMMTEQMLQHLQVNESMPAR